MAADGVVSAVVQTALGILSSAALQEIGLLWGFKDDLNSLERIFTRIQVVLQDADIKQRKNKLIADWLRELKNVAYDAENVLDRIATHALRRRLASERGMQHKLKSFLSLGNPLLFRFKMVHRVRNIGAKLDAIAKERHDYHLVEGFMENRFGETLENRQTSSLVEELEIVGRNEEREKIIGKLLESCDQEDLSIYAILGMGGLGKTTLAQLVYNDERTKNHFELRMWISVSDDFSITRLARAIMESLEGGGCNISELDPLQRRLQERLKGRRFLLVLDDLWDDKHNVWDELKKVLRCGSKDSVLMITTRIEKVALMMANSTIHHIGYLSEDDSWSLFRQRAFPTGKEDDSFAAIGKVLVKKCGGVPLAIKALGSLMSYKSHKNEWLAIKESEIWHLIDGNDILPALMLSYYNLQPQMRQCFAFCCIFPKDYVMEKNELIQLWMANGYIPSDGVDLYLTGQLIFKELIWRSFLQDVKIDFKGDTICKMHDLMHDLASSVMQHEACIIHLKDGKELYNIPKTIRHLSFNLVPSWGVLMNKCEFKLPMDDSLRSIIGHGNRIRVSRSFLSKQQYLRALDTGYSIVNMPKLVCKFEQLRYLVLSCSGIEKLPESLTRLVNLQTLKFVRSFELLELPKSLRVMKNLLFLEMESFNSLLCTPPGLGDLTLLRRLSIFIVGQDASHQIDQLKELNLQGQLSIQGLHNVRNLEDAKSANLMTKYDLTSLSLSWKNGIKENSTNFFEEVLEGFRPHQNLEKICIKSYQGSRFPHWISTPAFNKMVEIRLEDCRRCEHLPPLGKLPSLRALYLIRMGSLKFLNGDGESSFPAPICLTIYEMPNLEEWTVVDSPKSFPCLERSDIRRCPKFTRLPKLASLKRLSISSSNSTLLRSVKFSTSLTSLCLSNFAELDVFPEGLLQNHTALENLKIDSLPMRTLTTVLDNLYALKTLTLEGLSNLEFLPEGLKYLKSLETFEVHNCDVLQTFPATILEALSSLKSLSLRNCKRVKPLLGRIHNNRAPNLHHLVLCGLPEMEHLPECMQLMSDLRVCRIFLCEGLRSLPNWLSRLESLEEITIMGCMKLKSLPHGFISPNSLRKLEIYGCTELVKRCKKPNGEDWPKISPIPFIRINEEVIQRLDQELT